MWEALCKAGSDEKHPPLADAMEPAPVPARTLAPSAKVRTKQTGPIGTLAEILHSDLLCEDKQKLKRCVLIEANPVEPCNPKLHGRPASQPAISQPARQPASRPVSSRQSSPLCTGGAARVTASKTFSKGRGNGICNGRSGRCSGRPFFV